MGVVYSSTELFSGRIPAEGDHIRAAEAVRDSVSKVGGVVLVLVHGSVPEARFNTRSDLDVLATYMRTPDRTRPQVVEEIKETFDLIAETTNVKIEPNIWPADDPLAAIQERMYDLLFSWHLAQAMENKEWLRGEIDERVLETAHAVHGLDAIRRVAMNYVVYKADGFAKAPRLLREDDPRCLSAMPRGFELPKAAGRKASQLKVSVDGGVVNYQLGLLGVLPHLDESSKEAIEALVALDREYSLLLAASEQDNEDDRQTYLEWLRAHYSLVIHYGIEATTGLIRFVDSYGK